MKTLYLDIETAPATVLSFSLFKPVLSMDHIIEHPRILGFSYMWDGDKKASWVDERIGYRNMIQTAHELWDEADVLVTYNGATFDLPWIEGEFILQGLWPPAPAHHIDLYQHLKRHSRFITRKLDYAAIRLLDDRKVHHSGLDMWKGCMAGKKKAWSEMKKYALKDTELLPPLYDILKPWIKGGPNAALIDGISTLACPRCGSTNRQARGTHTTSAGSYPRYRCSDCGKWYRGKRSVATTEGRPL